MFYILNIDAATFLPSSTHEIPTRKGHHDGAISVSTYFNMSTQFDSNQQSIISN